MEEKRGEGGNRLEEEMRGERWGDRARKRKKEEVLKEKSKKCQKHVLSLPKNQRSNVGTSFIFT